MSLISFKTEDDQTIILNPASIAYVTQTTNMDGKGSDVYFASDLENPLTFSIDFLTLSGLLLRSPTNL